MSFSTLYVGATGVVAHNENMQVVANNLANVSTNGYKKADMQFGDLMSQQVAGAGAKYQSGSFATSQMGKGVGISEIRTIFKEGSLQNTNTATDLAIMGEGFFGVYNPAAGGASGPTNYTRAGAFRFNNEAYLVDPSGYRLMGHAVDRETDEVSATVSAIQLPYEDVVIDGETTRLVRSEPQATSSVEMVSNLDATATDSYTSVNNPFFAMLESYNAVQSNATTPFGDSLPEYSSSILVYDEDGNGHDLTFYFDPVNSESLSNAVPGYTYWEYVAAIPEESDGSAAYGTSAAGLVGVGILTFDSEGQLVNQMGYSLDATASGGGTSLSSWTPTTFNEDGLPEFTVSYGSNGSAIGTTQTVSYDFGLSSGDSSWVGSGAGTAAGVGLDVGNIQSMGDVQRDARVSTSYDLPSATMYHTQNGFSWGYLQNISVDREGFLNGHFTNGQNEQLYQLSIYRFNSPWGLRRVGGTNFVETAASGNAIEGTAGDRGRGIISQNTLEESNVDMAEEFANMIVTQRGFQANTKIITTADGLLNTAISTKR